MKREQRQVLLAQQGSSITRERERESSSRLSEIFSSSPSIESGHNVISPSIVGGNPTYSPPATRVGLGGGLIPPPPLKQS